MAFVGSALGVFNGAGSNNAAAMNQTISSGKSWGSKAFLESAKVLEKQIENKALRVLNNSSCLIYVFL